ncbi:MAG TPA: non-homologous end-joining DNA ligase [Candidatus Paceibacterota bacterium]|nr:non-homologous end-joining DNA ligase [Candidatus Paceibacterota bacterium]
MSDKPDQEIKIGSHTLNLSNLDKVFWPHEGYTKGDVIEYYRTIAKVILPYLKDRPENLHRHPNGIEGESFYQKDVDHQPPSWVKIFPIHSESTNKMVDYVVCNDEATLIYLANLACIELNPWSSRTRTLRKPDYSIIDLDPETISFDHVVETAQVVHEILEKAGVKHYAKTSGATGIHIVIPLEAKYTYEQSRDFAHLVATLANQQLPKTTSLERSPAKRQRKIYLDYLQNNFGQTLTAPYCLRPRPGAPVSTPLEWHEVKPGLDPKHFNIKNIHHRLQRVGDLWKPVIGKGIDLEIAMGKLSKV